MEEGSTEPNIAEGRDLRRLTVPEAATVLGVTVDAIRGRIRRKKLKAARDEHGTVYVFLNAEEADSSRQSETSQRPFPTVEELSIDSRFVEALEDHIASLERQLEDARAANRENRRLLAAALERIPAIEPPGGKTDAHETPHKASGSSEPPPPADNNSVEEEDARLQAEQASAAEPPVDTTSWRKAGLAAILAGVGPVSAANLVLVAAYLRVGYDINQPPLLTAFLIFYLLVHLLPLPLGLWAGLAWPGKGLSGYVLLSVLAGAIEAISASLIIGLSRGLIVWAVEDYLAIFSTFTLFLSGALYGALVQSRRKWLPPEPGRKAAKEAVSNVSLPLIQTLGPALIGLVGTIVTVLATFIRE